MTLAAPSSQKPPAVQIWHAVAPVDGWKEPAEHGAHSVEPREAADVPAPHGFGSGDPAAQAWPSGHSTQVALLVARGVLLKKPSEHSVTLAAPTSQ